MKSIANIKVKDLIKILEKCPQNYPVSFMGDEDAALVINEKVGSGCVQIDNANCLNRRV